MASLRVVLNATQNAPRDFFFSIPPKAIESGKRAKGEFMFPIMARAESELVSIHSAVSLLFCVEIVFFYDSYSRRKYAQKRLFSPRFGPGKLYLI